MSGIVGALVEAWDEVRIHKLRVLLSLIGVAAAVMAITGVTAAIDMLKQAYAEQNERYNGRQVTVSLNAYQMTGMPTHSELTALDAAFADALARYDITYSYRDQWAQATMKFPGGDQLIQVEAVDADLGTIRRVPMSQGHWFGADDEAAYAPRLVVNQAFLDATGETDLSGHPSVLLGSGDTRVTAVVVGVYSEDWPNDQPSVYALYDQLARWAPESLGSGSTPTLNMWVPRDLADDLSDRMRRDVAAAMPGWQVDAWDNRNSGIGGLDGATRWVALGVGGFALLLGGLGLVNISLVTVRYRIREIGIRRSFGATSGRIFFGVMLESVVATVVAGAAGVALAIVALRYVPIDRVFGSQIEDMPPFPVSAAVVGMAAATVVGALAGLIPALVAVRVKVIDAIRY